MLREHLDLHAPGLPHDGVLLRFGHAGRPVLAFPTELGRAWEWEDNGMVGALAPLIDEGRLTFYCVDSYDAHTWSDHNAEAEERAQRYRAYERWLVGAVVPEIAWRTPGDLVVTGASLGAYHAVQFALTRADIAPTVLALSGNYDPSHWNAWGHHGDNLHWLSPGRALDSFGSDHLAWLRSRLFLQLVVGRGQWETMPTGALSSTHDLAARLAAHGIRHDLDVWGDDVAHHWHWWQRQLSHHMEGLLGR